MGDETLSVNQHICEDVIIVPGFDRRSYEGQTYTVNLREGF